MKAFLKEVTKGEKFELTIDTKVFSKDIILKAAYNFLDKGYFFFSQDTDKNIVLQFTAKEGVKEKPEIIIWEFSDDLLDVYLRDKLEKDNKVIRETIVTRAINGPLDLWNFVSLDTDNIAPPANQEQNQIDFDKDIDDILKEIEEDPDLKIDEKEIESILKEIEEESQAETKKPEIKVDPKNLSGAKDMFKNKKKK